LARANNACANKKAELAHSLTTFIGQSAIHGDSFQKWPSHIKHGDQNQNNHDTADKKINAGNNWKSLS
jgi:hypothetical protein